MLDINDVILCGKAKYINIDVIVFSACMDLSEAAIERAMLELEGKDTRFDNGILYVGNDDYYIAHGIVSRYGAITDVKVECVAIEQDSWVLYNKDTNKYFYSPGA